MDLTTPGDNRVKMKEGEKRYKDLDLAKALKKTMDMKETEIPIVIGELAVFTKGLVNGLKGLEI